MPLPPPPDQRAAKCNHTRCRPDGCPKPEGDRSKDEGEEFAFIHARIWAQLEAAGKRIGYYDLIVAATALERGASVATFNKRDFGFVPGLDIIEPG